MRHAKRLRRILTDLSEQPTASVPQANENTKDSRSCYRFWANPNVQAEPILSSHRRGVINRMQKQAVVLAIQDTTELNFTTHRATEGLGFINQTSQQGLF